MGYKSIVLNLDIDGMVAPVIKLGVDLTQRFDARLIGLSAADVAPPVVMEGGMAFEGGSVSGKIRWRNDRRCGRRDACGSDHIRRLRPQQVQGVDLRRCYPLAA